MHVLKRIALCVPLVVLVAVLVGVPTVALGRDDGQNFRARLIGINETWRPSTLMQPRRSS